MPRNESRAELKIGLDRIINTMMRVESHRRADKQKLMEQQTQIRGSLRVSNWIDLMTDIGVFGGFIGGLAFGAAGSYEACMASIGVTFSSLGVKFGRNLWSLNNGQTVEDLDTIQARLHRDYNISPDQGFFDRAEQKRRNNLRSRGDIAALKRRIMR